MLDAHNCYPYDGHWSDRLDRALATGTPLAVEQDLVWYRDRDTGEKRSVVSHGRPFTGDEPTLESYFFKPLMPVFERALSEGRKDDWPLVTLNLDFKNNSLEHLAAVWDVLQRHRHVITTATKTDDPGQQEPLDLKPLLILTSGDGAQYRVFYEDVPTGGDLLLFGGAQTQPLQTSSLSDMERKLYLATVTPSKILPIPADNFHRWWNNSWYTVEPGGAVGSGAWTLYDKVRLQSLVDHAHALGYWIRFYTLNGHEADKGMGWSDGYNFGSKHNVEQRWQSALRSGVDFVATDMYEAFSTVKAVTTVEKEKKR